MSPFEQAEVLYIRLRSMQNAIQSGGVDGVEAAQVNTFTEAIGGAGRLVQVLFDHNDRGDLDDDDRTEIHAGQDFLAELRDEEGGVSILRERGQPNVNDLAQVDTLIRELETLAQAGPAFDNMQITAARWASVIGVNLELPEELETRRVFQGRVRSLREMFDTVAQYYRRWVLFEEDQDLLRGSSDEHLAIHLLVQGVPGCLD